ncbi:MAG: M3 family oligoendopeptidase [Acidimicrobiia bacterium]|nr:M3 family oligoendopeptidase [Acidimicrobiia bacterium]
MTATDSAATDSASESNADLTAANVTWDLETLLDGVDTPDALLEEADALASELEVHRGSVATMDAAAMVDLMQTMARIAELVSRAGHYGGLKFAENTQDAATAALMQRLEERSTAIGSKLMFVELEFAAADDEHAAAVLADERLGFCRHHLENTRRNRPYLLTEPEEAILLETSVSGPSAWVRLFSELTSVIDVDATWSVDAEDTDGPDDGGKVETVGLEQGLSMLQHPSRETRAAAAQAVTDGLAPGLRTRAFVYNTLLLDKSIRDRLRSYPRWITSRNVSNEASDESVEALVEAVVSRYDIPQRWYRLKARAMGVDKLSDYDRMAPMADTSQEVGWSEATAIVRDSYRSFSPELADIVDRFIDEEWIDAPIRPGKQPGAFCAYSVPSHHPYVMLNWASKTRDVLTLAHELGHGIHGYLAREQGIFHQSTPLTLAETASVFGETVTNNRLLGMIDDPAERFALLASVVDDSVATVFRQVAMNRFEDACHTERRTVGELSVDRFGELWIDTQTDMMGDSVELTDNYASWWSYIPHFIGSPGYVYAYAYGQLLALSVYARYAEQGDEFVPAYLDLLRAGGSMSPEDLGAIVDCDLADPSFWVAGLDIVDQQLARTEEAAEAAGVV